MPFYSDIIWAARRLQAPITRLFQQFLQSNNKYWQQIARHATQVLTHV